MRRTKIVCTLGPSSNTPAAIGALIDAGMDVARLNFSHGDHAMHRAMLQMVREESQQRGRAVAVLQDLQGPKIRIGRFAAGRIELRAGADFTITTRDVVGDERMASTSYAALPGDVKRGDRILLDDGYLELEVTDVAGAEVKTHVVVGGTLKDHKGINLPGVKVSAPALTEKDRADLAFGLEAGVDIVALSFVRAPEDVLEVRRLATTGARRVPVIAKLEKPEAVACLDAIVEAADGIMVARGDLGVEMGPEKVPLIQKRTIAATNCRGKVVITATQVLESMINNPRPTRAESSDVANAVLDGTDALMLSGETAAGRYPVQAVQAMACIIEEVERSAQFRSNVDGCHLKLPGSTNAIAHAAVVAAHDLELATIATYSVSGAAARLISDYRPAARIIAFTTLPETYRNLALYWGVEPVLIEEAPTTDEMIGRITAELAKRGLAERGEQVAITMGVPIGTRQPTNLLEIQRIA